ncbi:hypothetical protein N7E81_06575 [Reichenbachiella carrageenanivorans]|uniref:Uncharacterized protein n=1 Tax=Reichenbachiella carrageenanivorans TaxID=2979869 RepID=A0ABY6D6I9_9BACT|nr:hypothetical protein [Reichenbachiella carrageenanivorans]UXX80763.1 hypothetical protein N7E81_06575 [Reichenbachiella carrageenanivorans]
MKTRKSKNKFFVIKIILLTLVLMVCMGGVVASGVLMASKGFSAVYVVVALVSIGLGYWVVQRMIALNSTWMSEMISEIRSGQVASFETWEVDQSTWASFIRGREQEVKKDLVGMMIMSTLIAGGVFAYMLQDQFSNMVELVLASSGLGVVFGALISVLMHLGNRQQLKKMKASDHGQLYFTEEAILVNDLLIYFNQMGAFLKQVTIEKGDELPAYLHILTETRAGKRSNERLHVLPVPPNKADSAAAIHIYYQSRLAPDRVLEIDDVLE